MPLHKVEDLFTDRPRFLIPLVEALLKRSRKQREFAYDDEGEEEFNPNYLQQAKGIWVRNLLNMSEHVSDVVKE